MDTETLQRILNNIHKAHSNNRTTGIFRIPYRKLFKNKALDQYQQSKLLVVGSLMTELEVLKRKTTDCSKSEANE